MHGIARDSAATSLKDWDGKKVLPGVYHALETPYRGQTGKILAFKPRNKSNFTIKWKADDVLGQLLTIESFYVNSDDATRQLRDSAGPH